MPLRIEFHHSIDLAPAIDGAVVLAYAWSAIFPIKREQARGWQKTPAKSGVFVE